MSLSHTFLSHYTTQERDALRDIGQAMLRPEITEDPTNQLIRIKTKTLSAESIADIKKRVQSYWSINDPIQRAATIEQLLTSINKMAESKAELKSTLPKEYTPYQILLHPIQQNINTEALAILSEADKTLHMNFNKMLSLLEELEKPINSNQIHTIDDLTKLYNTYWLASYVHQKSLQYYNLCLSEKNYNNCKLLFSLVGIAFSFITNIHNLFSHSAAMIKEDLIACFALDESNNDFKNKWQEIDSDYHKKNYDMPYPKHMDFITCKPADSLQENSFTALADSKVIEKEHENKLMLDLTRILPRPEHIQPQTAFQFIQKHQTANTLAKINNDYLVAMNAVYQLIFLKIPTPISNDYFKLLDYFIQLTLKASITHKNSLNTGPMYKALYEIFIKKLLLDNYDFYFNQAIKTSKKEPAYKAIQVLDYLQLILHGMLGFETSPTLLPSHVNKKLTECFPDYPKQPLHAIHLMSDDELDPTKVTLSHEITQAIHLVLKKIDHQITETSKTIQDHEKMITGRLDQLYQGRLEAMRRYEAMNLDWANNPHPKNRERKEFFKLNKQQIATHKSTLALATTQQLLLPHVEVYRIMHQPSIPHATERKEEQSESLNPDQIKQYTEHFKLAITKLHCITAQPVLQITAEQKQESKQTTPGPFASLGHSTTFRAPTPKESTPQQPVPVFQQMSLTG